jgi:dihydrofolate reductase
MGAMLRSRDGAGEAMTKLSVFIASSVDGYIATLDDRLDWLESAGASEADYGFDTFLASVDALAMGRGTYDHIAHLDPLPFGPRDVFVFTHRPPAPRAEVTFWDRTPLDALTSWEARGYERVYVDGGALISSFLAVGLIDDFVLTRVPVLLGEGRPLFHPVARTGALHLDDVEVFASGMVTLRYSRVRD